MALNIEKRDEDFIDYKLKPDKEYMVFKTEFKGIPYYKIQITRKDANGNVIKGYKPIRLRKGMELQDRSIIKIKKAFEDFYVKGYETIFTLFIYEYELCKNTQLEQENALNEFQNNLATSQFEDFGSEIEVTDDMLPF